MGDVDGLACDAMTNVAVAADLLADRQRILIFTGAGISTESGIPDFRGPNGLWTKVDPEDFTIGRYLESEEVRIRSWAGRFSTRSGPFEPNAAHRAVASLWESGRMIGCVTQNVDGLHQAGGLPEDAVAELHGNGRTVVCVDNGHRADRRDVEARWRNGEADPRCTACGSILKVGVVFFGELLPDAAVARASQFTAEADAVVAIGSTLGVFPAAYYPLEVASRGEPFIIVNLGDTDMDAVATTRIEGKAGTVVPELVDRLTR